MFKDGDMQDAIDERDLRDPTVKELHKLLKAKGLYLHAGFLLDGWLAQLESVQLARDRFRAAQEAEIKSYGTRPG